MAVEVRSECSEDVLLALHQAAAGIFFRWPGGLKINAVERKPRFQFSNFRRRCRLLHFHVCGSVCRSAAIIRDAAFHGVVTGCRAGGIEANFWPVSNDPATRGAVAVS